MNQWRTPREHSKKLRDAQNAGNVFTTVSRNAFWRRTAAWRHVYINLLHSYVHSLSLGWSLRHTNHCHQNFHRNPLTVNYATFWHSINSSLHWQPSFFNLLKILRADSSWVMEAELSSRCFYATNVTVTKSAYLVRKQWCSTSWLPCLRILSLGRPIYSQTRERLSYIKAHDSQTTQTKGWEQRSEMV